MRKEQTLDAVLGAFVPGRLLLRLPGNVQMYGFDGGTATMEGQATLVHEQLHFFQTLFTGYGQLAWLNHRQLTSFAVGEWEELVATHARKRIPLSSIASEEPQTRSSVARIERVINDLFSINAARFRCTQDKVLVSDLRCAGLDKQWPISPEINLAGSAYSLQGQDILEAHAQFTEAFYLSKVHSIPFENTFDSRFVRKTYTAAWDWFNDVCPGHPNDFPFVCDLALQASWSLEVPRSEEEWKSSHPAWRFVALTRALARLQCWTQRTRDAATWYERWASTLLGSCGYRSIRTVLEERRDAFAGKAPTALDALMRRAIDFRLQKPWCAANPLADPSLWSELTSSFPIPVIQAAGQLASTHNDQGIVMDVFHELQYQAIALQIAGDLSTRQASDAHLECGFARFGIDQGCEFQRNGTCTGRFLPSNGLPHPAHDGCVLGVLLEGGMNLDVRTIEIKP